MYFKLKSFNPLFRQYVICTVAYFNLLLLGMEVAWLSPVLVKLTAVDQTVLPQPLTDDEAAWIASLSAPLGILVLLLMGYLIDKIGRVRSMLLAFVPRVGICLLFLFANDVWMLLAGRLLCGLSSSITLATVYAYASEIANKDIRGAQGTLSQIMSSIGSLIMLSAGPYVSYVTMNIILMAVNLLLFIPQLWLPETPYCLLSQGHSEKCLELLISLRGSTELANEEMQEYIASDGDVAITIRELLKDKIVVKTLFKTMFFSIAYQFTGYNAITVYLQTILESTKVNVSSELSSVVIGLIQLSTCVCVISFSDRFGRKPTIGVTLIGMAIGLVGLGVFFKLVEDDYEISGALNFLPLVSLVLIVIFFNSGLGSIGLMMMSELYHGPSRALGCTCNVFATTLFIFITVKFFTTVVAAIGPAATYWILAGNCVILCLFIVFCLPETKGRTFLEIQQDLGRKVY